MNPIDYLNLLETTRGQAAFHSMDAVTIIFAFVAAAYFAAGRLSQELASPETSIVYALQGT